MTTLAALLAALHLPATAAERRTSVSAIAYDSRAVIPGALFVAITGFHVDGHAFLDDAFRHGAVAAVVNDAWVASDRPRAARLIGVPDTRAALSTLAAAFNGRPAEAMRVIGVTGTDGKTTTTYLISALVEHTGRTTGLMGTVDFKIGPRWQHNDTRQTTPEAVEVQALLAEMRAAGVSHAVIESSSHGLALHKLDDCAYDIAVVTYVGEDHLELHGTRDAYLAAKGRLFELLDRPRRKVGARLAVVNADDPGSERYLRGRTAQPVRSYGLAADAEVRAAQLAMDGSGSTFDLLIGGHQRRVRTHLPGAFNVSNILAAATVAAHEGATVAQIAEALETVRGVPGRMERIDGGQPFAVIVDYAHTGPALAKVVTTLRSLTAGRIIVVYGCAGGRSPERRAGMGGVAARLADLSVITTEDPHEESADAIIAEIAAAMCAAGREEGRDFWRVQDRRSAIRSALRMARAGDIVLLAGKGHESSIIIGREHTPWDERAVAREELAELGYTRTAR